MATAKRTPAAFEIRKIEYLREMGWDSDRSTYIAAGTADELVSRRLCEPSFFPEGRKRVRWEFQPRDSDDNTPYRALKRRAGGVWELTYTNPNRGTVEHLERELSRSGGAIERPPNPYWAKSRANAARERYELKRELMERDVARMPASHEQYRAECESRVEHFLIKAAGFALQPRGGFSFDPDTTEAVEALVVAIRRAIAEGRTLYSKAAAVEELEQMRAEVRAADPDFARFIEGLGGGAAT